MIFSDLSDSALLALSVDVSESLLSVDKQLYRNIANSDALKLLETKRCELNSMWRHIWQELFNNRSCIVWDKFTALHPSEAYYLNEFPSPYASFKGNNLTGSIG